MNNTAHNTNTIVSAHDTSVPIDTSMSLNALIRLTRNLSNLADREAQALAQDDMVTFSILQDEKTLITEQYMQASEDFRLNVNFYRGTDKNMLDRLELLQKELGEKTQNNNNTVEQIYNRAKNRTTNSLLAAQEIAQGCSVTFEDRSQDAQEEA